MLRFRPAARHLAALAVLVSVSAGCGSGRTPPAPGGAGPGGTGGGPGRGETAVLRLGHFPNLTHAQALLGRGDPAFERTIGCRVEWTTFNAGPSAVEALFAGAIDASYIGPNPAINGHIKSLGQSFVVVAGAASGGAALVVRSASGIRTDREFHGRRVATPQLGNTQDVAARLWFQARGYVTTDRGGDLEILPLANADQLLLMQRGQIDAAWTIEPWVSRLEQEAGARVMLDEGTLWPGGRYPTALLVVSRAFLAAHPDRARALVSAHVDQTLRLRSDVRTGSDAGSDAGDAALVATLAAALKSLTSKALPEAVIRSALGRIEFTWDPLEAALARAAADAHRVGFLRESPGLDGLIDRRLLDEVLRQRGLPVAEAPR
jgi:NitT/TauT family transport system substrate-binding protein